MTNNIDQLIRAVFEVHSRLHEESMRLALNGHPEDLAHAKWLQVQCDLLTAPLLPVLEDRAVTPPTDAELGDSAGATGYIEAMGRYKPLDREEFLEAVQSRDF